MENEILAARIGRGEAPCPRLRDQALCADRGAGLLVFRRCRQGALLSFRREAVWP